MKPAKTLTVLVPIDFSPASGAGLRFALQWASQQKLSLVCTHVIGIIRPTLWSDSRYRLYLNLEKKRCFKELRVFVERISKQAGAHNPDITYVLLEAMSPDLALQQYCRKHKDIDYVCIGTKGAGGLKKLFGTHTGNLITHSNTPVIAVPASYRRQPITRILYASDFIDYIPEIPRLLRFAGPLKAEVRTLHLNYVGEILLNEDTLRSVFKEQFHYPLEVSIVPADPNLSVTKNLQRHIAAFKPSMVALYTQQRQSALQRLLYPSVAERLSFHLKTPLLVFPKTGNQVVSRRTRTASAKHQPLPTNTINTHH